MVSAIPPLLVTNRPSLFNQSESPPAAGDYRRIISSKNC